MGLGTSPSIEWNHSKIQAKRVASWSAEPVPFGTFEPAKRKDGWGWKAWQHHRAQASSGTIVPVGTQPKRQNLSKIQAKRVAIWSAEPVPLAPSNPLKAKIDRWGWALAQASSGTIARQDSGQTGCQLVGRAGAVGHLRTR